MSRKIKTKLSGEKNPDSELHRIEIKVPGLELRILDGYCSANCRSRTDVLREMIRGLKLSS